MSKLWDEIKIYDTFLYEKVLAASQDLIPCFSDLFNYMAIDLIPEDMVFQ